MKLNNLDFFKNTNLNEEEARRLFCDSVDFLIRANIKKVFADDNLVEELLEKVHIMIFNFFNKNNLKYTSRSIVYDLVIPFTKDVIMAEILRTNNTQSIKFANYVKLYDEEDEDNYLDMFKEFDLKNFRLVKSLTEIEYQVCKSHLLESVSFSDIAIELEMTEDEVKEHYETGKEKIKKFYIEVLRSKRRLPYVFVSAEKIEERFNKRD